MAKRFTAPRGTFDILPADFTADCLGFPSLPPHLVGDASGDDVKASNNAVTANR